ncbi:hypothetical protein ACVWZZ_004452 [Bradyrhizobium sp. LM6.10]
MTVTQEQWHEIDVLQGAALKKRVFSILQETARDIQKLAVDDPGVTCLRSFIQWRLEPQRMLRRLARGEQRAIGGAGRGCAAGRTLR